MRMPLCSIALGSILMISALVPSNAGQEMGESNFFTTSDGVRIHYLEKGKGETLVFVPGILFPAEIWEKQIERFSKEYRVVAMDPRSHGRSERPTEGHTQSRRGRDIGELIDHVSDKPVVAIGWSLGVLEILTFAKENGTDKFKSLVLVDMFLGFDEKLGTPHPFGNAWIGWMKGLQTDRRKWISDWSRAFHRREHPEEYFERMEEALMITPTNTAVTLLSNLMHIEERDFRPFIDTLDLPVLFVFSSST
ncbi:MAG: alpha/beta hydrolase [Acidobacteria bacterium]|mgnify:CR=1 FL=1|nr:MAG: alpha/beta hydrolase [Acidobacteriota bacterium]REJ98029.1 MAG: alpha/beta hydrolase [Acidobacteriota bacterium]REK16772.1 MAG: alpha/beta hydrolase [Acidobacteriota bacterium]REK42683.1 MAG: alpha/beta hydrolase [Acidobacteriota bacterium]